MNDHNISLGIDQINRLCPYYMLIDKDTKIVLAGDGIKKLFSVLCGTSFPKVFHIEHVGLIHHNFEALSNISGLEITISAAENTDIVFHGQLETLTGSNELLFTGKPGLPVVNTTVGGQIKTAQLPTLYLDDNIQNEAQINLLTQGFNKNPKFIYRETLKIFTKIISEISNGLLLEDENRHVTLANDLFCRMLSLSVTPAEITGHLSPMCKPETLKIFKSPDKYTAHRLELLANRAKFDNVLWELIDGTILKCDFIPVHIDAHYKGNLWIFSDITESVALTKRVEQQKMFYEQILNNLPEDVAVLDGQKRYLFLNPVAIRDNEIRKWIIGKTDMEYVHFRNKPIALAENRMAYYDIAIREHKQVEWEETLLNKEGKNEIHLRKIFPMFDAVGELDMMIGYGMNITELKHQEERLRLSEKRYRDIFEYSQAMICTHDLKGTILSVNTSGATTLEYEKEDLIGKNIVCYVPENLQKDFYDGYLKTIIDHGKSKGVMRAITKTGKKLFLLYQNYLVKENDIEAPYVIGFSQNITERMLAQEALKKSEDKYRRIIEKMNLGMMEADIHERIIYVNHRFCEMTGYERGELVGKEVYELLQSKESHNLLKEKTAQRKDGISDSYEIEIKTKSGVVKWWLVSGAPFNNESGEFSGSIGIFLDISEQKLLQEELRNAKDAADRSASSKEMFLANMSHEIRTPINAILGLGKLLGKGGLTNQQQYYLQSILSATENLLVIVNDVLDFSKIEAGKIAIENICFDIKALIVNAVTIFGNKAEEKGLVLSYKLDKNVAPLLIGDPFRLNQVMMNLLSNAIKFTEQGTIIIKTSLIEDLGQAQKISISVTDTGIGMNHEFLAHLFDKFTQEDASVARKFGGTGLGMSISKQLVDLMGGVMSVESVKNRGTSFSLSFEMKKGNEKDIENKKETKADSSILKGKNILLVEDNEMNRLVACTILAQYEVQVTEAENGLFAVEAMKRQSFDLVLMDVQMPEMDGYQATGIIRKELKLALPIIALTANALMGEKEKCIEAGMDDFLSKPYDEEKLINTIAKWLGSSAKIKITTPETIAVTGELYDMSTLELISDGNDEFMVKMLNLFITEVPLSVYKIREAYKNRDFKTVKFFAHRIKPSLVNMNINSLKQVIIDIETLALTGEPSEMLEKLIEKVAETINIIVERIKIEYKL